MNEAFFFGYMIGTILMSVFFFWCLGYGFYKTLQLIYKKFKEVDK